MEDLKQLFENNRAWAQGSTERDPDYFKRLQDLQQPRYLWIGCADSRIPANQVVGMEPGELFVHRNVANLFVHTDVNCLSVLEYAVLHLKVEHVIVCGHYGCGGVKAAMSQEEHGLVDNWLRHIRDIYAQNSEELDAIGDEMLRMNRLAELSVMKQVQNVSHSSIVQKAWSQGQPLAIHGVIYSLGDGLLKDLNCSVRGTDEIDPAFVITG